MLFQSYYPWLLGNLVTLIWEQRAHWLGKWQILPSGYLELIFSLDTKIDEIHGKRVGEHFNPTRHFCFLSGLHTKPLYLNIQRFHNIGIRFHPIAIKALFGFPCSEVTDWAIISDDFLKEMAEIEERLKAPDEFITKAKWLEQHFLKKLNESSDLHLALKLRHVLKKSLTSIYAGNKIQMDELTGYSRMHTHKLFSDWFGLSPGRTLRLQQC
ncbi:MAG: hypothetical protein KDC57_07015 [Saprospiraceae bacterium]|nr:hypothetical protein [Saprospiraceae bacterium]